MERAICRCGSNTDDPKGHGYRVLHDGTWVCGALCPWATPWVARRYSENREIIFIVRSGEDPSEVAGELGLKWDTLEKMEIKKSGPSLG